MLAETFSLDRCASPGVPLSGTASSYGHAASPKDCHKLSINFLSSDSPRAEAAPYARRRSSGLSNRARGVNRAEPILSNSEDVEVATEVASDQARTYRLEIVQHPDRTAEFGASALTRLPLAPPLIAQLVMRDSAGRMATIDDMELPFLVAQLSLLSSDGASPMDYVADGVGRQPRERLLYGNLVSSPHVLRNLQGRRGVYFMFPDVSIKQRGRFQLKVSLIRLPRFDDPAVLVQQSSGTMIAEARSLPFDVYPLRDYVAPGEKHLGRTRGSQAHRAFGRLFFAHSANPADAVFPAAGCSNVRVCYYDSLCPRPATEFLTPLSHQGSCHPRARCNPCCREAPRYTFCDLSTPLTPRDQRFVCRTRDPLAQTLHWVPEANVLLY